MRTATRPATLLAAFALAALCAAAARPALADVQAPAAAPAAAAPSGDPATNDMRCIVVAGALLQSDDEQMRSLGRANLFYYLGRLQGRGDVANLDARIVDQAAKMSAADIGAEAKSCGAMFTAATQALQDLSNAFAQHFRAPGGGTAPK
jgi:hypothetical protein